MNHLIEGGKELSCRFPLKAAAGMLFLALLHHALMFLCFTLLVLLDLISRWLAIAAGLLRSEGQANPSLLSMAGAIPRARRLGLINSRRMKEQGLSKLILYHLCVLASACADYLLSSSGHPIGLVSLSISYLAAAEALSVIENLSEAGFHSMTLLLSRLRRIKK